MTMQRKSHTRNQATAGPLSRSLTQFPCYKATTCRRIANPPPLDGMLVHCQVTLRVLLPVPKVQCGVKLLVLETT